MHLFKTFILSLFVSFLSFSTFFYNTALAVDLVPKGGTLVATVNIRDATITSQQGNTVNVAFTITNREGVQNDVRYGVQLISVTDKKVLVDEKVFSESLYLAENSSLRKSLSYTAPTTLSGTYELILTSKNSANFPFAFYPLGKVTFNTPVKGIMLNYESCTGTLDKKQKTPSLSQTVLVQSPYQIFEISCTAVNNSKTTFTATPVIVTREQGLYGEIVKTESATPAPIVFKSGEKKNVSFVVPVASKPQTYVASITLTSEDVSSNTLFVTYKLRGETATISNLSLDKDFYKRGDVAALSIVWLSTLPKVTLSATLTNSTGMKCAKAIEQDLIAGTTEVLFPVNSTCRDPQIAVELKDSKGIVLDQKDFSAQTSKSQKGGDIIPFVVLIIIATLIILVLFIKRHKKTTNDTMSNPTSMSIRVLLPIILLAGVVSLVPFSSASADTYTSPGGIISSVTVSPINNTSNGLITVTAFIQNNSLLPLPVSLTAINDIGLGVGNPSVTIIPQTTLSGNGNAIGPVTETFTAPSPSGTYAIKFETGVDIEAISSTPVLSIYSLGAGWLDGIGAPTWEAGVTLSAPVLGDQSVSIRGDTYIDGYYDNQISLTVDVFNGTTNNYTQSGALPFGYTYTVQNVCVLGASSGIIVNPSDLCI